MSIHGSVDVVVPFPGLLAHIHVPDGVEQGETLLGRPADDLAA
ncbi:MULTISPECIES: hypothetical protein [unclassified Streptomyces]